MGLGRPGDLPHCYLCEHLKVSCTPASQALLLALSLLALVAVGSPAPAAEKPPEAAEDALPSFHDITNQASVGYKITCGDPVTHSLIDVNGQGACFLDYDGDGFLDIYLANGSSQALNRAGTPPHDYLLRNQGDGTFADVTKRTGLGDTSWSSGCAVGDYDNDGGVFADVTDRAGVGGPDWTPPKWTMGAAFADVDNDGDLDLFAANFTKFDPEISPPPPTEGSPCKLKGVPIVCAPDYYEGQQDLLYLNNGDGTFGEAAEQAGLHQKKPGHGFAVVFSDYDDDGDQDLYVANDSGPNFYYENNGKAAFNDISWESGGMVNEHGEPEGSMGLTVGDYNNDGRLDVFITNFIEQSNTLYENDGDNMFIDQTSSLGLHPVGFNYSGWGTKFIDFDNDGRLDLFITNGHTDERLEARYPTNTYAEPNYLLRNVDGKRFVDVSDRVGMRKIENRVGRGTAFADFDNDGDVDILVINKNEKPRFCATTAAIAGIGS